MLVSHESHLSSPTPRCTADAAQLKAELQLPEDVEISDELIALFANSVSLRSLKDTVAEYAILID